MTFDHINRRVHLYLALFLLPWFAMYGISSLTIHHRSLFRPEAEPDWTPVFDRPYSLHLDPSSELDAMASAIMREAGFSGPFRATQPSPEKIEIRRNSFWSTTKVVYNIPEQRLVATQQRFAVDQFLVRMHVRAGFHGHLGSNLWAYTIDLVCVGFLLWVFSGLYMWWKVRRTRKWGMIALAAGGLSFAAFLASL